MLSVDPLQTSFPLKVASQVVGGRNRGLDETSSSLLLQLQLQLEEEIASQSRNNMDDLMEMLALSNSWSDMNVLGGVHVEQQNMHHDAMLVGPPMSMPQTHHDNAQHHHHQHQHHLGGDGSCVNNTTSNNQLYCQGMHYANTSHNSLARRMGQASCRSTPQLPVWHQSSYMGGVPSSSTLGFGQPNECGPIESMFVPICGPQGQQLRPSGPQGQIAHGSPYATHTGLGQPQGAAAVVAGTVRPRVRARRGQATDPHSIAERLRRERIAERMKALQELVPSVNKTDKASMLDEIIEYVRFLQLQVKVLSMSRIPGTGIGASFAPDEGGLDFAGANLFRGIGAATGTGEDNMEVIENQVARLMEESMGLALQFLQSKGLCLMPISLATTMSGNASRPATTPQSGLLGWAEASSTITTTIPMPQNASNLAMRVNFIGDVVVSDEVTSIMCGVLSSRESLSRTNNGRQSLSVKCGEETSNTS